MINFLVQCYSNYRGLFMWMNIPGYISAIILQPIASILMYALLGRFAGGTIEVQAVALGITVFSMAFVGMNGLAQSYSYDRSFGTISFVFVSTTSRLKNFLSRSIPHYPNSFIAFGCGIFASWFFLGMDFSATNWAGLALSAVVLTASISAAGQVLGVLSIAFKNWIAFQSMALGILLLCTGVVIPIKFLPHAIAPISEILPITNGLSAVKSAFMGEPIHKLVGPVSRELIVCLGYYTVGYLGFILIEKVSKTTGILEQDVT